MTRQKLIKLSTWLTLLWPIHALCQTTSITGTFRYPDGVSVNGTASIQLTQPSVTYICGPVKAVTVFKPIVAQITAGNLAPVAIYPTPCITQGVTTVASGSTTPAAGRGSFFTLIIGAGFSVTAGTGSVPGVIFKLSPGLSGSVNKCEVTPTSSASIALNATSNFDGKFLSIESPVGLTAGTSYAWSYICGQPYIVSVSDQNKQLLYKASWIIPNQPSVDVIQADITQSSVVLAPGFTTWTSLNTTVWSSLNGSWQAFFR